MPSQTKAAPVVDGACQILLNLKAFAHSSSYFDMVTHLNVNNFVIHSYHQSASLPDNLKKRKIAEATAKNAPPAKKVRTSAAAQVKPFQKALMSIGNDCTRVRSSAMPKTESGGTTAGAVSSGGSLKIIKIWKPAR